MSQPTTIHGIYGHCLIQDCLTYMATCHNRSYDFILSDIPWGQNYDGQHPHGINVRQAEHTERQNYTDVFDPTFYLRLWTECRRLSPMVVFCPGWINFNWWIKTIPEEPIGYLIVIYKNGQNSSKIAKYQASSPYICWGDPEVWKKRKFFRSFYGPYAVNANCYQTYISNGFLRVKDYVYNHPSPKDFRVWYQLIKDLFGDAAPVRIYDPCAGSCPIGEVGEALSIHWDATEIQDYIADIKYRIAKGQQYRKLHPYCKPLNQQTLT